jgi:hypothetical protein
MRKHAWQYVDLIASLMLGAVAVTQLALMAMGLL